MKKTKIKRECNYLCGDSIRLVRGKTMVDISNTEILDYMANDRGLMKQLVGTLLEKKYIKHTIDMERLREALDGL